MKYMLNTALLLLSLALVSCTSKNPDPVNAEAVKDQKDQQVLTGQPKADLYANAIKADDIKGRATWSLGKVKELLNSSSDAVPGIGNVEILIDDELLVIIRNDNDGDLYETRFNLFNMDPNPESMEIIVNRKEGEFPGLKLAVLEDKPGVDIYRNGNFIESKRQLEIIVAERSMVQRIASAMMQAIQAAHGEL